MLHRWLHPVRGAVVRPDLAAEVVTPAYDALDEHDRAHARDRSPRTFLHALPTTARPGAITAAELDRCAAAVGRLRAEAFVDRPAPFVAVYRLEERGHVQTGLVADLDVGAIGEVVRGHEHTLPEREDDLVDYLDRVGVQSSPVCLAAPDDHGLATALGAAATTADPDVVIAGPELEQRLWVIDDRGRVGALLGATAAIEDAVITDGHHRAAAAARHPSGRVVVALFPASELQVSGFHRVLRPPLPVPADEVPERLRDHGLAVEPAGADARPSPGHAVLRTGGAAWVVGLDPTTGPGPDVRRLHDRVLGPVLGVDDPRRDPRLHHVPTTLPGSALRAATGPDGVSLTCVAPTVDDLLAAAREDRTLPPKSTYVRPKARSGLLLVPRGRRA